MLHLTHNRSFQKEDFPVENCTTIVNQTYCTTTERKHTKRQTNWKQTRSSSPVFNAHVNVYKWYGIQKIIEQSHIFR